MELLLSTVVWFCSAHDVFQAETDYTQLFTSAKLKGHYGFAEDKEAAEFLAVNDCLSKHHDCLVKQCNTLVVRRGSERE